MAAAAVLGKGGWREWGQGGLRCGEGGGRGGGGQGSRDWGVGRCEGGRVVLGGPAPTGGWQGVGGARSGGGGDGAGSEWRLFVELGGERGVQLRSSRWSAHKGRFPC